MLKLSFEGNEFGNSIFLSLGAVQKVPKVYTRRYFSTGAEAK